MQTRWFTLLCGIALAAMLTLLVGQRPVVGQDDRGEGERRILAGTWNVTLKFPDAAPCSGPGGVPNIPIPALQTYLKGGSILEVPGGFLFRGPGVGSWEHAEHLGHHQFVARFKFFLFNSDGSRRGSEVVTSHIDLTGPNAFEAKATFDLFDAAGNPTAAQGCHINETATRFE
jgi:hypothetical protein